MQHDKPCGECPFSRTTKPGTLGGSSPMTYVGQAYGPFWLPCHSTHDYTCPEARLDPNNSQCAGAAIHRANIGRADLMPQPLLHLPPDCKRVFATQAEFLAHHLQLTVLEAEVILETTPPDQLMQHEFRVAQERAARGKATVTDVRKGVLNNGD